MIFGNINDLSDKRILVPVTWQQARDAALISFMDRTLHLLRVGTSQRRHPWTPEAFVLGTELRAAVQAGMSPSLQANGES